MAVGIAWQRSLIHCSALSELHGEDVSADVSGPIGQYAHGNEPQHSIMFMCTVLGRPDPAANWLRVVSDSLYKTGPDGLSGNDDCGRMSAWLVWSVLGMYPMNPVGGDYVFGYPLVDRVAFRLSNGRMITVTVKRIF